MSSVNIRGSLAYWSVLVEFTKIEFLFSQKSFSHLFKIDIDINHFSIFLKDIFYINDIQLLLGQILNMGLSIYELMG